MDQPSTSNHGEGLPCLNSDDWDGSGDIPTQTSNQAANDGSSSTQIGQPSTSNHGEGLPCLNLDDWDGSGDIPTQISNQAANDGSSSTQMGQPSTSNHGEGLPCLNSDDWDGSGDIPTQISNQAANDGSSSIQMGAQVYKAAAQGNIEFLKEVFESEFQVHLSPNHNTILHIASEFGQTECVEWILALPSSSYLLQRRNVNGDTPLHLAAREGHLETVKALLEAAKGHVDIEAGEDRETLIRMKNEGKNTALHEAVRFKHSDVVKSLIDKDSEFIYCANDSGITPLYMAAERGFTGLVKLIIDKSRTPSYKGLMGRTALHAAVICNDLEMTKTILEWQSKLTEDVDENGCSPLHYAAERGCDLQIVELLLEKSGNSVIYLKSKDRTMTALHIASFHHHIEIVEKILSHSPGCREQVDDKGNNVLHFAMMKKGDDDFKPSDYFENYWLRDSQLVNGKDVLGNTPIHLLSLNQISDFLFLNTHQVDKKAYNNENLTAYDIILSAKEDISEEKDEIRSYFEMVMPERRWKLRNGREKKRREHAENSLTAYDMILRSEADKGEEMLKIMKWMGKKERREDKEKRISELREQGKNHLIVSALITTVTFAACFTLPGGYKQDSGQAMLSKETAFRVFVMTNNLAMVSSLSAVLLHFLMTLCTQEKAVAGYLVCAFILTMIGMEAMAIAFATGLGMILYGVYRIRFLLKKKYIAPLFYRLKRWYQRKENADA